jgi:glycosyltransferase involved in cell wall biosynthesis
VFVGRLAPAKAVDVLIAAVGLNAGAELEIVGDGPERATLEQLAQRTAPGHVRFLGQVDRAAVGDVMRAARAVVLPSRSYENQPMALLEAMALGLPVIGTDLGGIPELIDPGGSGLLVPVDDPTAIADAMATLQANTPLARSMGEAGRQRAIAVHAPDVHLGRLHDIYASASEALDAGGRRKRRRRRLLEAHKHVEG